MILPFRASNYAGKVLVGLTQKSITYCGFATISVMANHYLMLHALDSKKSIGVPMPNFVRRASAGVKCFILCVSSQSRRLQTAESRTGTSASCRMRRLEDDIKASSGYGTNSGLVNLIS